MFFSYARVSTDEQAEGTSIDEQTRRNELVAKLRGAKEFDFASYSDRGVSGNVPLLARPAGAEMLDTVKEGDTIIAVKLDRMFRNAQDALFNVERFKDKGIDLIITDIGYDPVTTNGSAKLFFTILAGVAEFERDRLLERTADGRAAKRRQFHGTGWGGGQPPWGYKKVGLGREARLEADPEEVKLLVEINGYRGLDAASPWHLCRHVNRLGYRDRKGSEFRVPQMQRLMKRVREGWAIE